MTTPNPFEQIFEQIAELLAITQESQKKPFSTEKLDDDIDEQVDDLEKQIGFFKKITDEALKRSGLDDQTLQKTINNPPNEFGSKDKRILDRAKKLRSDLENLEREFSRKSSIVKLQKKKAKTAGKKRIKKFKRLGGQGWMPM
jgi:hypothetical protein